MNNLYYYLNSSSREIQLQRLMKRDKSSREAALSRLNAQLPLTSKLDYADNVLDNSGSLQDLESQINSLVKRLEKEVGWTWQVSWLFPPAGLLLGGLKLLWRALKRSRSKKRRTSYDGSSTQSHEMTSRSRL
jgi:dephospho-CoA kinase